MAKAGKSVMSGGGKWALPDAQGPKPVTSPAKPGGSSSVAGASKHANTQPQDFTLASTLSAKNKLHQG